MNAPIVHEWISRLSVWSLETSLAVLLPALVVLCISHLRLIPARWCALLAALLLVRMLLPEVVPVSWRAAFVPQAEVSLVSEVPAAASSDRSGVSDSSDCVPAGASLSAKAALPFAWALGAAGVLTWLGASAFQIRRLTRTALPADSALVSLLDDCARAAGLRRAPRLALIEGLPSVAVHGFFRPLLLLPADVTGRHTTAELRGIFLHELQHLKRADCAWTWLGLVACAVHWFNPFAWLLFRRFCADRELACDEAALHHMHQGARRSYGEALLKTAELYASPVPALLPSFSASPSELKYRMKLIMRPASRSLLVQFVSVAVGLGIATVAFTTARANGEKKKSAEGDGAKEEVRKAAREGDGDGARKRDGARDGDGARKEGARDGETKKTGARDGEGERKGPRDGEMKKTGAREGKGEGAKRGARDGEGEVRKSAEAEGGGKMREGERGERPSTKSIESAQMIIQVNAEGSVVNSKGEVIDIKMVRGRMKQIADENPDQSVILRADSKTEIGKVRAVLDALKDVGLKDVKLETK
ncbi:MAG: biopolymer transporter ExbD [Verrucomicrobiaceae bacterium]|nr:biopolymer transporter ExbD [Verrucomicrobiaceae bacterium]